MALNGRYGQASGDRCSHVPSLATQHRRMNPHDAKEPPHLRNENQELNLTVAGRELQTEIRTRWQGKVVSWARRRQDVLRPVGPCGASQSGEWRVQRKPQSTHRRPPRPEARPSGSCAGSRRSPPSNNDRDPPPMA